MRSRVILGEAKVNAGVLKRVDELVYMEIEPPEIDESELLIRVKAASICGTDLRIFHGKKTKGVRYPSVIGHEFAGEVAQVGDKVTEFVVGERVCLDPVLPCGGCFYCLNGMENVCQNRVALGYEYDGCFAEYIKIPSKFITQGNIQKLPTHVPFTVGALAEPLSCVINGQRRLNISVGDTVVIIGAGPIGIMHMMVAKASGASKIIVSEPNWMRRETVGNFGADITIDPIKQSLKVMVLEQTDGLGADVVILAIGNPKIVNEALAIARKGGRISLFAGFSAGEMPPVDVNLIHYNELVVIGASALQRRDMKTSVRLIASGAVNLGKLVTDTFPLRKITEAFAMAESGEAIKVVLEP
ncbi:MAG: threonine dehydrogenase [Spirochaetae bacterium HGW-Spirochaetae-4]|nr:MAG: threonine dehydrogenase [Spirochaetae bacterium HGW-Spirochaetae-8]PKL19955.1 MAG: threonine dehydrogenase [Spirochaetae bacterium HGW-Spirochaetae-4]